MKQYYPEESFSSKRDFATKLFCLALVLLFGTLTLKAQNCTVNAGVLNETICENDVLFLNGNIPSPIIGPAEWSQVSGPSVIIVSPNSPNTEVTGYTGGNTYVFRYSATCGDGVYTYQDKTVVVQPITTANAGTDIASCPNSSGSLVITGNVPENSGETGQWQIVGNNGAGVVINFPNSPTSTITLPQNSCGTTTLRWTITGPEYAPGQFCQSSSDITVTNYGGQTPVYAGPDQTLGNCYTVSQSADLSGSFGGCNLNGQSGTWEFVSGPNTPVITSPNGNLTSVNNLIEGTYIFRWTVTGPCVSGSDDVSITVPAATQDVTTLSGGNENIYFCDNTITQVTLEAQTPLYSGETVEWTQIGGDPGAVIESPNNPTTLVTNISNSGDPYTFRYTLTNSVTGCVFTKDYIVHFSGPTRTIEANGGNNIHGGCNENQFSIPLVTTGNGVNRYRIVSGPAASPLGPFPTSPSNVGSTLNINLTVAGTYIIQFARVPNGDLPIGCDFGFDSMTIVVSGNPTPSNAGSNISLDCGITTTQLAGVPPAVGISAWTQVSGPNQATITNNFDPETTVTGLVSGTYVFQYITKGEGARCGFSTANVEVYVSSSTLTLPDAGADDTICVEGTVTLSANAPQAGEYGEWSQVSGPDIITFSDVNDPNAVASGFLSDSSAYVLRWTIGYSNPGSSGCSAPVFDDVEITTNTNLAPTTAIAGPDACYPSGTTDVTLSANDPTIFGIAVEEGTWSVSPAAGITFDDVNDPNTTAHNIPSDGTYTFTWSIQRIIPICDASTDDMVVTVADTPLADAGPDQQVCDETIIMAATLSNGAQGTWTRISGPGSYTISDEHDPNATFTFTFSGFYTFRWTVDAGICSTNFDDVNLTINVPVGTVDAGPDQDICAGDSTILAGSSYDSFFETGEWSLSAGAPNVPVLADASDPNTTVSGLVAGTYIFTWTISSKDYFLCPPVSDTMVIEVSPPANAGDDATYCDVTSIQLIGNDNSTGTWTQVSGPASTIIQSPANSYVANATVIPGNTYVFQYETDTFNFTSGGTCPGSTDTVQVEIFSGASVDPDAGSDQKLCIDDVGGTVTMAGNSPPGDVTLAEWRWLYQPTGSVATIDNPTDENTTISNLTVEGLYVLEWVFESASCRSLSDVVRVNMYAAPSIANAGPDDTVACQQTYQTNAVAPTVGIGTWSFANPADDPSGGDVVIDNPNNPVTTLSNVTTLGTYTLTWTVTNGPFTNPSLCEPSVDTVSITFNDDPPTQADAGADQKLCAVTQTNMAAVPLTSGLGTWTQTSGPNTANIASPNDPATLIFDMVAGTYEFTWTATTVNNDGCSSQDTMQVIIYEAPSSANAGPDQQIAQFSPVIMAATAPTVGSGRWTQISGPTTVGFTLNASPTTTVTGTIAGTYVLQWNVDNGTCDASTDQVTVEIVALADLELSKSVSPTTGNEGDTVTFTIEVFNNDALGGSVDATGVAVKDIIPAGYALVPGTVSNSGIYNLGDNSVTWSGLAIANGDIVTLTFNATINGIGPYVNTAQITASDQIDPDSTPNNNIASEDDQDDTTITVDQIDLSLQKSVTPGIISIGESVVFTIQVDNAGPDNATGVTVSDQLPDGYVYISDNGGGAYNPTTGIWTIGSVTTGSSATLEITATVTVSGNYENIAEVATADQNDVDSTPGNGLIEDDLDSATVNLQQADLELVKNVSDVLVNEGDTVTFTLTLSNNGPGDATGVEVQDYLPNGYTLVPGSVSSGGLYQIANSTINWSGLSLASGTTLNLTFDAIAVAGGSHFNTAQVTASDLPDPDSTPNNDDGDQSEDDESGIDVSIIVTTPSADLSLTKSVVAGNTTPLVGTQISFELIITNDGPDNATGVQVTDLLPSGYDFVNFSSSAGLYDENTGLWNVGTVDSGTSESLIIDVIVLSTGNYENITEVTASDLPDPDSTPNNDDGDQSEDDEDNAIVTPVSTAADLSLTKTVNNATPLVGSQVIFEVVVTNSGPQDATGVQVTDLLPDGYTYNSFTATTGTYNNTTGLWTVGTLTNGQSVSLQITATVNATGNYENIAEVTASDLPDPDSTPNNAVDTEDDYASATTVPISAEADLSIIKTVLGSTTPLVGGQVTFSVTIRNIGPQDATGVQVTDLLPDGYTFVSYSATSGSYDSITGLWDLGGLSNGSNETLQVTATVNASGNYLNVAEVSASDQADPDSTPNNDDGDQSEDDEDNAIVTPVSTAADLSLTKTVNNATPLVGAQVIFEVVITNAGPQDATGVEVTDFLPDGYTYNNFTATTGTYNNTTGLWTVGTLTNGQSVSLQVTTIVNASGNYENIAEVTASDLPDPDSTPNNDDGDQSEDDEDNAIVTPVSTAADLSLTKTVNNATPLVGSQVIFEVVVTNSGPQDATGVQVTDLLPDGYTFISSTATAGSYNGATGLWVVGSVATGSIETLQVTATATATGNYENIAEVMASDLPDPDSTPNNAVDTEDDYASAITTPISTAADLSLTKTVNNATPLVGSQVIFEVVVTNAGPQDATGVEVTDFLPDGYTYNNFTATTGTYNNTTGLWTVGTLTTGQSVSLQIIATVNASGNYENIAEVTASDLPDPDSTPNNAVDTEDDYASVITVPIATAADLSLTKTVNNATPLVGSQIIFEVVVTNAGPQDATGVEMTDLLPDGYTYNSFTATTGTYNSTTGLWIVGTLTTGQSVSLQVIATVNATGNYENIAEVTVSDLPDPDSTPNNAIDTEDDYASVITVPIATAADLSLTKTVNNATPLVGSQVIFEVVVTNAGPQDATGVEVTDLLPDGYTFISSTATAGSYNGATGLWVIGSVATGSFETLQITTTVTASGNYENIAEVTASDLPDPDSTPNNAVDTEDDYASAITTPIATAADLSLTKTVNNTTPLVGSQIIFEVVVSNDGPQDATGVEVTDFLPDGYTYNNFTATTGTYNNTTGLWTVGTLTTGQSVSLQIIATVNTSGNYENIAEVTASDLPDPDSTPNNAVDTEDDYASATTTPIATAADLSLTKTVNNTTPLVGSQIIFEVVVSNDGPQDATGVEVTDLLPDGYTFISSTATAGSYNGATGLWVVGSVATDSFETLQVTTTVNASGNYENIAEVTASDLPDPDSTPNNAVDTEDDYASAITTPIATAADLSLTKTVNNATPLVGSQVIFEVVVTNSGPQDATGVEVTDLLPEGYTYNSFTATTGTYNSTTGLWNIGLLTNGQSVSLQITATVNASGNYENIAEVTASDLPDPDSTPNNAVDAEDDYASAITTPIATAADLSLTKTVNNTTPLVGSQVIFEVVVTNDGPQDATGIQITDLLPDGYTYNNFTATTGTYNSTTGLWTVGTLTNGQSVSLQIIATVNGLGNYENIAEVTASDLPDPDSIPNNAVDTEDDYASVITVPIPISADLSITKTVNHPTPLVGSGVVFTITVTNDGPQDATGVQVTDLLPDGYSFIVATTTSGIYNNQTGIWEVGTVASGVSETLLINASVLPTGNYLNIAEVTGSDTPDPDSIPGNGLDTEDDYASVTTIPIAVSADLSLTKTVNNPTPLVGNGVIFTITITNDGPQTATGVVVTDLLPSGYSYVVATTTAGIYNNTTGEWVIGTLPSGMSETLLINGIVQPMGDYLNVAEITSSNEPDPDSTPDNGLDTEDDYASVTTIPIAVSADLSLTKTVNNPLPLVGSGVIFEIIVTNDGPQTATGVVVTDLLPSGYSYVVATTTGGIYNSTIGEWSVGTLPAGTSESLLINAIVQPSGDYLNIAEVTSSNEPDPDSTPDNGVDTEDDYASAITVPIEVFADLSLTKTVNNTTPIIGNGVTFEIIVTNDGPQTATGVVVTDLLPSGYSYVIASSTDGIYNSNTGQWLISALPSGTSQTLLINGIVQATGDYLNVAEVTSSNEPDPDSTPGNAVDTEDDYATAITNPIIPTADLSLTKTIVGGNDTPLVGSQVIFNIEVSNEGPAAATGVVIKDILPSGYTFVSYNATGGIYNDSTGLWTIGNPLLSGTSISLQITAVVNNMGDYTNTAEVFSSDVLDPDSTPNNAIDTEDDYASVTTIPIPLVADLSLTKTVNNTTPLVGSQVIFEVVVSNDGPQDATGVEVTDLLPDGYTYNSFTATTGTYNSTTGLWNIGLLTNGQSVSLQIIATVNASGNYENIAEVTASDLPDPDSTPNNAVDTEDDYASVTTIPIAVSADLSLTKTVNNATPLVGSQVIFEVVVTNDGPQDATGVEVTDLLPDGYTYNNFTATTGTYNSTTGLWNIGLLTNGQSVSLQITATVAATGNYENIVEVTASDLPDPDSTPNNAVDTEDDYASVTTTPIATAADLFLTKTVNNAIPLVGSQVIFEVVVANDGPQDATGVQVTDLLPDGYTFISSTSTAGSYNGATGLWVVGTLATGSFETLQVTTTVTASGNYENIVEVTASDLPDPDSTPNNAVDTEDDYASVTTTPIATAADLSLTKTVNNATPLVGSQVIFEVVVTNSGPQDATGVEVTDLLPDGYTYNNFTATTGTYNSTTGLWNIGLLTNGQSVSLQVIATVNVSGNYLNIAEVTASDLPDLDSTPNNAVDTEDDYASVTTTPIATAADLSLTKTVNNATPLVGSQIIFEVVVTNDGPQDATGVQVTDLLPDGYAYNSFTATTGTYNNTTGLWTVGTLTNGQSVSLQITAMINASGNYENIAEVTASDLPDPDSTPNNAVDTEDDYASVTTTPIATVADLSLTKTVNNATPLVGSQVIFEVVVTNSGPQDATGVEVTDLLPDGYTYNSFTATTGTYNNTTGLWTVGVLTTGQSVSLQITAMVNTSGNYENIAEVTASDLPDPDSTPNNAVDTEDDYASVTTTPIATAADLSLTKTVNNTTPLVGSQVIFEVVVTNSGPQDATGVEVTDLLPNGYTYNSFTATTGTYNSTTGLWNIGLLTNGQSSSLQIIATVNASGNYENIAEVTASDLPDPDSTPNNDDGDQSEDDEDSISVIPQVVFADLSITKNTISGNSSYNVGDIVAFEVTVTNDGPGIATGVIVQDALPSGFNYISYTATSGTYNNTTGLWTTAAVQPLGTQTLLVYATVNAPVGNTGEYLNIAEIMESNLPDPDSTPGNGIVSEDDYASLEIIVQVADLSLNKSVSNSNANVGEVLVFTLQINNDGPVTATGVAVEDIIPVGYDNVTNISDGGMFNGYTITWSGLNVPLSGITLTYEATVYDPTGLTDEDYKNIAQITDSDQFDPDSTPNNDDGDQSEDDEDAASIEVPRVDIAITKTVDETEPAMNTLVNFTITAENLSSLDATAVIVSDELPNGYEFDSYTASLGDYNPLTSIWSIPQISANGMETLVLSVKVIDNSNYLNIARLESLDQEDNNPDNNEDSASVSPKCLNIYSEFSPNGDGDNDTFYIDCIINYPNNVLRIYNRWGDEVFSAKGYDNSWTGTSDGPEKTLPVGTYFYVLDLGDGSEKVEGWLYLKR